MPVKLSDYVADFLVRQGLRHVFLLPGGACMHLTDSVGKRPELDYVCCLHEQTCAFAAEAYGEFTNTFGCALVTAGPGSTNALTGVACAWIEGSPCLFISGQAKRADLLNARPIPVRSMGPQEVDIVSIVKPMTKFSVQVVEPSRIREYLEHAVWAATHGRKGPVWLDIPLDVQASMVDPDTMNGFLPPSEPAPDHSADIEAILSSLAQAKRPVIFAGNGVRTAGQVETFRALAAKLGAPVLLTWKSSDFLAEEDPVYIGRPGAIGQRAANFTQQKADWILVLGARLDLPSLAFSHAGFAPRAQRYFVDVDPAELAKFDPQPTRAIHADLRNFLPALANRLVKAPGDYSAWLSMCRGWVKRFPVVLPEHRTMKKGFISTYVLIDELSKACAEDDVLVPGSSGPCSDIFYQAFRVKRGQRILNAPGLGAMGTGLPGTIGACLAAGGRRVVNVNGDGGFQLNIQDLETVRRLNLPIKYFVLDNNGYRSIVAMQRNHFQGRLVGSDPSSRLTLPNLAPIAQAYGIPVCYVEEQDALPGTIAKVLASAGPSICIVKTSADEITVPRATSEVLRDGRIVSKPIEDMAPLLDRAEFAAIMAQ